MPTLMLDPEADGEPLLPDPPPELELPQAARASTPTTARAAALTPVRPLMVLRKGFSFRCAPATRGAESRVSVYLRRQTIDRGAAAGRSVRQSVMKARATRPRRWLRVAARPLRRPARPRRTHPGAGRGRPG